MHPSSHIILFKFWFVNIIVAHSTNQWNGKITSKPQSKYEISYHFNQHHCKNSRSGMDKMFSKSSTFIINSNKWNVSMQLNKMTEMYVAAFMIQ